MEGFCLVSGDDDRGRWSADSVGSLDFTKTPSCEAMGTLQWDWNFRTDLVKLIYKKF